MTRTSNQNRRRRSSGGGGNKGRDGNKDQRGNKRTVAKAGEGAAARGAGKSKSPIRRVVQGIKKANEFSKTDSAGKKSKGGRGRSRVGKGLRRGGTGDNRKKPLTAEDLDRSMDEYWMKSENKDAAIKKLDEAMDEYWERKGKTADDAADAPDHNEA